MKELKEMMTCLDQVAVVVKDGDKAKEAMKNIFGLEPTDDFVKYHRNVFYRGKPSKCGVRILVYNFCNIELEIMTPVDEEKSLWRDFMEQYGGGLHHIRFSLPIDGHEIAKKLLEEKGIKAYQSGDSTHGDGIKFAYYDLGPDLGFILETLNCPPEQSKKNPNI